MRVRLLTHGLRMDASLFIQVRMRRRIRKRIYGSCRYSEITSLFRFCEHSSTRVLLSFLRTATGLLMSRTSQGAIKCTSRPSPGRAANGRHRGLAAQNHDGAETEKNFSSWRLTTN